MDESIASHVARCLGLFRHLVESPATSGVDFPEPSVLREIGDERSRFKIWSGSIGAHRTGMASLDYRLRDASHIRAQTINLLQDLIGLIEDAAAIGSGEMTPWDQLGDDDQSANVELDEEATSEQDSPSTELGQIATNIADAVDCLLSLSVAIRNPAPHDRFTESKSTDTSWFEPFDIQHVLSKFNTESIEPWLAERLGKAISRRRQYFRYRASHHAKLSRGLGDHETADGETVASSIAGHLKETGSNPSRALPVVLEDDRSDAGASQTSYATSAADSDRLSIPQLPKEAHHRPFVCHFCHMVISANNRASWKRHVYSDLQPYICLEKDCMTPERGFSRRHQWMDHVRQTHWNVYTCPFGCNSTFTSFTECRHHLATVHPDAGPTAERDAVVELSSQPLNVNTGVSCPLCHDVLNSARQYKRHVGRHQEQLSLFALPSLESNDESGRDESDRDGSDSDEAAAVGSRASGLEEDQRPDESPAASVMALRERFLDDPEVASLQSVKIAVIDEGIFIRE